MDCPPHFRREIRDFTDTARSVTDMAPLLRSCPGWSMTNIVMHLGWVHRYVTHIIANRLLDEPTNTGLGFLHLPPEHVDWPTDPNSGPHRGQMPTGMLDWFAAGADTLAELFATTDPTTRVSTWSAEQSVAFWLRMQTIEAAIHRWDAQTGLSGPSPIHPDLAVDIIEQTFEVMAPRRRSGGQAPVGRGETFRFHATDVDRSWTVRFDGDTLALTAGPAADEFTGSASDLALFLWHRVDTDTDAAKTWFTLVPPS